MCKAWHPRCSVLVLQIISPLPSLRFAAIPQRMFLFPAACIFSVPVICSTIPRRTPLLSKFQLIWVRLHMVSEYLMYVYILILDGVQLNYLFHVVELISSNNNYFFPLFSSTQYAWQLGACIHIYCRKDWLTFPKLLSDNSRINKKNSVYINSAFYVTIKY